MTKRIVILVVIGVLAPFLVVGQKYAHTSDGYFTKPGSTSIFSVDFIKSCAVATIKINATNCVGQAAILNGVPGVVERFANPEDTVIYYHPGTYKLKFTCNGGAGIGGDVITITVMPNPVPTFDLFACPNGEVYLKITDINPYNTYLAQFPPPVGNIPGMVSGASTQQTLPSGNISVRGRYTGADDNCVNNTKSYTAVPGAFTTPNLTALTVSSQKIIDINYSEQNANVPYDIGMSQNGSATFNTVKSEIVNTGGTYSQTTAINPDLGTNYYCFKVTPVNKCSVMPQTSSNTVCSINFQPVAASDENDVIWTTSGMASYDLQLNNSSYATPVSSPYVDKPIVCKQDYPYKLIGTTASGATSTSLEKSVKAFSTTAIASGVTLQNAVVNDAGTSVDLDWTAGTNLFNYTLLRVSGGVVTTLNTESYTDATYNPGTCYEVIYTNTCDVVSPPSNQYCPVQLSAHLNSDNSAVLSWNNPDAAGTYTYTIEKYNTDGQLVDTQSAGSTTTFTDPPNYTSQTFTYRVIVNSGPSQSNLVKVIKQAHIVYPSAFTPNHDGNNDKFNVVGQFVVSFEMKIFNRWGEMMFTTTDINDGWDGTYHGLAMQEDTYVFVAHATDEAGREFSKSGSIVLLRKK